MLISPPGVLLLDKPIGVTSNGLLQRVKKFLISEHGLSKREKIGHTGSLDPLATGLLPICIGRAATKWSGELFDSDKTYRVSAQLGIATDSYDSTGQVIQKLEITDCLGRLTRQKITECIENFVGDYEQTPPIYSALKYQGKALYRYAHQKRDAELLQTPESLAFQAEVLALKKRVIQIKKITVYNISGLEPGLEPGLESNIDYPTVDFEITCTKGTYIRSIVADLGEKLGVGANVVALRRTRVGVLSVLNSSLYEDLVLDTQKLIGSYLKLDVVQKVMVE